MWFHGASGRLGLSLLLTVGQKLSIYQILAPLGAGAMGAVWRARDTRLAREVAIKVLPEEFAADEERLRRFEREARVLATLNHPNVAQIYGVDQVGDTCFLVLELVPGQTREETPRSRVRFETMQAMLATDQKQKERTPWRARAPVRFPLTESDGSVYPGVSMDGGVSGSRRDRGNWKRPTAVNPDRVRQICTLLSEHYAGLPTHLRARGRIT